VIIRRQGVSGLVKSFGHTVVGSPAGAGGDGGRVLVGGFAGFRRRDVG
jgi:hypothetical protein